MIRGFLHLAFLRSPVLSPLETRHGKYKDRDYSSISSEQFSIWMLSNKHDDFPKALLRKKLISSLH